MEFVSHSQVTRWNPGPREPTTLPRVGERLCLRRLPRHEQTCQFESMNHSQNQFRIKIENLGSFTSRGIRINFEIKSIQPTSALIRKKKIPLTIFSIIFFENIWFYLSTMDSCSKISLHSRREKEKSFIQEMNNSMHW